MLKRLVLLNSDIYSKADIELCDCDSLQIVGHNSWRTTEIYTYVRTKSIQQIKSPFDDL